MRLNGNDLFQFGPLDQGWWPDGLYTAPSYEAMMYDVDKTKDLGFNTIRKHVKVEPALWYTYCDKKGIIVWQDMPNGDRGPSEWQTTKYFDAFDGKAFSRERGQLPPRVERNHRCQLQLSLYRYLGSVQMRHGASSRPLKSWNGPNPTTPAVWSTLPAAATSILWATSSTSITIPAPQCLSTMHRA